MIADYLDSFSKKYQHIYRGIKWNIGFLRGYDRLRIDWVIAKFRTENKTATRMNRFRYQSEKDVLADLLSHLRTDDVFYDIGANTGLYSMFAGQVCDNVISFEPYEPNVRELQANAELNDIDLEIITRALSDRSGEIEFRVPEEDSPGYGTAGISTDGSVQTVTTVPGDKLIDSGAIPAPTVVKIDVEGAEPLVIEGLSDALSDTRCRSVYCEVHVDEDDSRNTIDDFDSSPAQIEKVLTDFGFRTEWFVERDSERHLKATR